MIIVVSVLYISANRSNTKEYNYNDYVFTDIDYLRYHEALKLMWKIS